MSENTKAGPRCPICGETAPEPAWLCLYRIAGSARPNEPCSYSIEGDARTKAVIYPLAEQVIAEIEASRRARARASGIPVDEVGGDDEH